MLDSSEGVYCCAFATIYASQNSLEGSTCEESGIPKFQKRHFKSLSIFLFPHPSTNLYTPFASHKCPLLLNTVPNPLCTST
jgi:hypothetical protein